MRQPGFECSSSLEDATKLVRGNQGAWTLSLYPTAGEAGGSFRSSPRSWRGVVGGPAADPERARQEADRRARTKSRRYSAANRLTRLGTLTYAGLGVFDPKQVRLDVHAFFRGLREHVGGPLPYLWVPEWHKRHGLHVHFGVNRFIRQRAIRDTWGHGHVDIRRLSDLPVGLTGLQQARVVGAYLAKYVGKSFGERGVRGLHRYEVAQGFQPPVVPFIGATAEGCLTQASVHMGAEPSSVWRSENAPGWQGPPAVWAAWNG